MPTGSPVRDIPRHCAAVGRTYDELGVGIVELDSRVRSFRHEAGEAPEIDVITGPQPEQSLVELMGREINRPFARPRYEPFRFSLVDAGAGYHEVVLGYDHWVADSIAARLLLKHVLGHYLGMRLPEGEEPLERYPGTYRHMFGGRLRGLQLAGAGLGLMGQWLRNRSTMHVPCWSNSEMALGFQLRPTCSGTPARLHSFARAHQATVHDVMLAALARSIAAFLPRRAREGGKSMGLGTIVDTRRDACDDLSRTLGTFLAYYAVHCRPDQHAGLGELGCQIGATTAQIKSRRGYFNSVVNMKFVETIWPFLGETTRRHFMRKALPLVGGISNVYLPDDWINRQASGRILRYARGASTGPMTPLVLTPTTVGDEMNVGASYRLTAFSSSQIGGILDMFLEQIEPRRAAADRQAAPRPGAAPRDWPCPQTGQPSARVRPRGRVGRAPRGPPYALQRHADAGQASASKPGRASGIETGTQLIVRL